MPKLPAIANTDIPGKREAQREAAREGILTAAGKLFAEHGYNNVSLERIASAAGYTKGNLLHYFGSKQKLQTEVIDRYVGIGERGARGADEPPMDLEAIQELAASTFHFFRKHPEYGRLTTWAQLEPDHELPEGTQELVKLFSGEFRRAQEAGHIRDDIDPRHAHATMYHMIFAWFLTRRFFLTSWGKSPESESGDKAYLADMLKVLERGLKPEDS